MKKPTIIKVRFLLASLLGLVVPFVLIFVFGDSPERRYSSSYYGVCQSNMIYAKEPTKQVGLLTVGGSALLTATDANDFNKALAERKLNNLTVHNIGSSYYGLDKSFLIFRDLTSQRKIRSALIMLRYPDTGYPAHRDSVVIAKISDIPLFFRAYNEISIDEAISTGSKIVLNHFRIFDRFKTTQYNSPKRPVTNCNISDERLKILQLEKVALAFPKLDGKYLKWDPSTDKPLLFWVREFSKIADENQINLFFIYMTRGIDPLASPSLEENFQMVTGHPLIIFDKEMHDKMARMGREDITHINSEGRKVFLPWLINKITKKCPRGVECF